MPSDRVLVTGSNGLIGYALCERLLALGRPVVGMDRARLAGEPPAFDFVEADVLDVHRLHATLRRYGAGAIVHCGGISGPMLARDNPFQVFQTNTSGTLNVCEAARITGTRRVVLMSSINVYGEQSGAVPVPESAPLFPAEPYGASKVAAEAILRAYAGYGVEGVALRISTVYGPRRTTTCHIRTMLENALLRRPTRLSFGGDMRRQYIYVDDVVHAILAALDAPALPQMAYNIASDEWLTLPEVATRISSVVPGIDAAFEPGLPPSAIATGPLDTSAARRDLGFTPEVDIAVGAKKYAAWLESGRHALPVLNSLVAEVQIH